MEKVRASEAIFPQGFPKARESTFFALNIPLLYN
jgi:hypothetical protein